MQFADLTLSQGDDPHIGEFGLLMEAGDVLLVPAQPIQALGEDHAQAPDRGPGCKASRRERVACFYSATLAWNSTGVDTAT